MNQPPFESLPQGPDGTRLVDLRPMSYEEYTVCQWHIRSTYTVVHPHRPGCLREPIELAYWEPTLAGLQRWSQLRRQRAAEDRQARSTLGPELDMTEYFDALDDQRPSGYVRRK